MFVPIFFLGIFVGYMYSFSVKKAKNIIWVAIYIAPLYYFTNIYGKWSLKIIGQGIMYMIVIYFLSLLVVPYLDSWLKSARGNARISAVEVI